MNRIKTDAELKEQTVKDKGSRRISRPPKSIERWKKLSRLHLREFAAPDDGYVVVNEG